MATRQLPGSPTLTSGRTDFGKNGLSTVLPPASLSPWGSTSLPFPSSQRLREEQKPAGKGVFQTSPSPKTARQTSPAAVRCVSIEIRRPSAYRQREMRREESKVVAGETRVQGTRARLHHASRAQGGEATEPERITRAQTEQRKAEGCSKVRCYLRRWEEPVRWLPGLSRTWGEEFPQGRWRTPDRGLGTGNQTGGAGRTNAAYSTGTTVTGKRTRFGSRLKRHQDQERLAVFCCKLVVDDVDMRVFLWGCLQRDGRKVWTSEVRTL